MVTIYTEDGEFLASASVRLDDGTDVLVLADLDRPDTLLQYYFGRGGSRVSFELDGQLTRARLSTHWRGSHRVWFARTETSVATRPPTAAPVEGAAGAVS